MLNPQTITGVAQPEVLDVLDVDLVVWVLEVQSLLLDFVDEVWKSKTEKVYKITFRIELEVVDHFPDFLGQVGVVSNTIGSFAF